MKKQIDPHMLNYVFEVQFKSCAGNEWVTRACSRYLYSNGTKDGPYDLAGKLAARLMDVTERGVRVTHIGLQKFNDTSGPITPFGSFTLTLERIE